MNNVPFPLIIPIDEQCKIYKGYITLNDKEYFIQVQLGAKGRLSGSKELELLISEHKKTIETKLLQASDIMSFLVELKDVLEASTLTTHIDTSASFYYASERYHRIYHELADIGFHKIHTMNDTMDEIVFQSIDAANRSHLLKVSLPMEYPYIPPQMTYDLPTSFTTSTYTTRTSIKSIVDEFERLVNQYQPLFNCLDDIDKHMRIIEPDPPKRSETYRKIALGYHCSLYIDLGPNYTAEKGKPTNIRFFGSQSRVQDLKAKWKSYVWKKDESMHTNLKQSFQIVSSGNSQQQTNEDYINTNDLECGICYSYKLDGGELPEVICSNSICNRGFHSLCLYEWLRSNPSTTTSFNILFGQCPYCNERITIKAIIS